MSGVNETDLRFEAGVVFNAGGGELSCSWVLPSLPLTDPVEMSVFTFNFLTFFEALSAFVGSPEALLLPLMAFAQSSAACFDFLTFFRDSPSFGGS